MLCFVFYNRYYFIVISTAACKSAKSGDSSKLSSIELEYLEELGVLDPTHNNIDGEIISVSKTKVSEKDIYGYEPRGPIGTNYKTMYVTVTRINAPGYDQFQLDSYFKWDRTPFFGGTDGIALAWSDNFTMTYSAMTLYYKGEHFTGYNSGLAYLSGTAPEVGVGYAFPIRYNTASNTSVNLDNGTIRARVRKHDSTGTANMVAKYVHTKIGLTGPSFSYDKSGPTIGVSLGLTYDHREISAHWAH